MPDLASSGKSAPIEGGASPSPRAEQEDGLAGFGVWKPLFVLPGPPLDGWKRG